MSLPLGQLDDVGLRCDPARGTRSRYRLRWLVRRIPLASRTGVHPRRNEVFLLELLRMAGQIHALIYACVLRTPYLKVPNRPEQPMIHHVLVLRQLHQRGRHLYFRDGMAARPHYPIVLRAWALHRVESSHANPVIRFSWAVQVKLPSESTF